MLFNPFSKEAIKKFIKLKKIPAEAYNLAIRRIEHPRVDEKIEDKIDAISLYLILDAALLYGKNSREVHFAKKIVSLIVLDRVCRCISKSFKHGEYDADFISSILSQFLEIKATKELISENEYRVISCTTAEEKPYFAIRWTYLLEGEFKITDFYIYRGYAFIGVNALTKIIKTLIEKNVDYYISTRNVLENRKLVEIGNRISLKAKDLDFLTNFISRLTPTAKKTFGFSLESRNLRQEYFPPCVKKAMLGVGAGLRNYAITMLLTSFISYARIAPTGARKNAKISDYIKDITIVKEEILPIIYKAAQNCTPPLFDDQPTEKMNILYHLGFGLTQEPRLEDSGKSKWYFPPNCDKIRRDAPQLCEPDEFCRNIKNPLSYYVKRVSREGIEVEGIIERIIVSNMGGKFRIKAKLRAGDRNFFIIAKKGAIENLIPNAENMEEDELGKLIEINLVGKRVRVKGKKAGNRIIVKKISEV
ncbi:MAG: hypothetical protein DRN25_01280 [Thermoplasmata archaeon]|nr:MAG: hypothetical protein DRN25_01280 [Thermoplasmata archaeon]